MLIAMGRIVVDNVLLNGVNKPFFSKLFVLIVDLFMMHKLKENLRFNENLTFIILGFLKNLSSKCFYR